MPCTYYSPEEEAMMRAQSREKELHAERDKRDRLKKELDLVTRLLCDVCHTLGDDIDDSSDELRAWWAKHQKADEKRRRVEAAKQKREEDKEKALAKLTAREKKLLGLAK